MTQGSEGGWGCEFFETQPQYSDNSLYGSLDMSEYSRIDWNANSTAVELPEFDFTSGSGSDPYSYFLSYEPTAADDMSTRYPEEESTRATSWSDFDIPISTRDDDYWSGWDFSNFDSFLSDERDSGRESVAVEAAPEPAADQPGNSDDYVPPEQSELTEGVTTKQSIMIDGKPRDYYVHVPPNFDPDKPTPVVLVFNGVASHDVQLGGIQDKGAKHMETVTGFSEKADEEGFVVVYLDGNEDSNYSWNNRQIAFSKSDDIKFTKEVLGALSEDLTVDDQRIYAAGFSQGESFVHRAANDPELRETFAAIGVVSGWMTGKERDGSSAEGESADPLSIISIHSGADPVVPYQGRWNYPGAAMFAGMQPESQEEEYYRERNGISQQPSITYVYSSDSESPIATESTAVNPQTGQEVTMLRVEGLGHVWSGGLGGESEIDATDRIWDFFERHSRDGGQALQSPQP